MELRIEHLDYIYQPGTPYEKTALKDISLTINSGEFVGMIGHTGSGKSTLVQLFNALLKPSAGRILANGQDISSEGYPIRQLRQNVGVVFQYPESQLFESDILKDICFGPRNQGLTEEEALQRAREAMRAVGMDESYEKRSPFELSGGQKRRVAIAGVLAMNPDMLVLDEPTAGMDPEGRREILDLMKEIQRKRQITIILVSHSMEDMANYADRLIVLEAGRIRFDDTPREVFLHTEELEKMGLKAPQVSYIMRALHEKGWDVDPSITTIDAAAEEILSALRAGNARLAPA